MLLFYDAREVITSGEDPTHCNTLAYSNSKGSIRLVDMRQSVLCDTHSQMWLLLFDISCFLYVVYRTLRTCRCVSRKGRMWSQRLRLARERPLCTFSHCFMIYWSCPQKGVFASPLPMLSSWCQLVNYANRWWIAFPFQSDAIFYNNVCYCAAGYPVAGLFFKLCSVNKWICSI
jgi:hypothetical protein